MAIKDRIKGIFGKGRVDLSDSTARAQAVRSCIEDAVELRDSSDPHAARKAVQELADKFAAAQADPLEVYRAAEAAMPGEEAWLREIVRIISVQPQIAKSDLSYLEREAARQGRNLGLWRRLLEEHRNDRAALSRAKEALVLAFHAYFPAHGDSSWFDIDTEGPARSLFYNSLDEVTDAVIESGRSDSAAVTILEAAREHFPDNPRLRHALAQQAMAGGQRDEEALQLVLESLMENPGDLDLKAYAGEMLASRDGMEEQAFSMLAQVLAERPSDASLLEKTFRAALRVPGASEEQYRVIDEWYHHHPLDREAAMWLAHFHLDRGDTDQDSLRLYQIAAPSSSRATEMFRLISQSSSQSGEWERAGMALEQLASRGDRSPETINQLAATYARAERIDPQAAAIYAEAVDLGSDESAIHALLCRSLYETAPSAPESVARFEKTFSQLGYCLWAQIGLIRRDVETGDPNKAIEQATLLLGTNPDNAELIELSARALAENSRRQNVRLVMALRPATALAIFERAAALQPDALLILSTLARYRLSNGERTEETARLLAEICRRDPEEMELRIARADILFDMGQLEIATQLYRDIVARLRGGGMSSRSMVRVSLDETLRLQRRAASLIAASPHPEDAELLAEVAQDPATSPDDLVKIADAIARAGLQHPMRAPILERAATHDPDNLPIAAALALDRAGKGNPRPALKLALQRLLMRGSDRTGAMLLEAVVERLQKEHITTDILEDMIRMLTRNKGLGRTVVVAAGRIFAKAGLLLDPRVEEAYQGALRSAASDVQATPAPIPRPLRNSDPDLD